MRRPRASSYVLHPLPPQVGGKESEAIRTFIVPGTPRYDADFLSRALRSLDRGGQRPTVRLPTVLANRAVARGAAQAVPQRGVAEPLERIGKAGCVRAVVEEPFPSMLDQSRDTADSRRDDGQAGGHVLENL